MLAQLFRLRNQHVLEDYSCAIQDKLLLHGRLYITKELLCFYSKLFGVETRRIVPFSRVLEVRKTRLGGLLPSIEVRVRVKAAGEAKIVFTSFFGINNSCRNDALELCIALHRQLYPERYPSVVDSHVTAADIRRGALDRAALTTTLQRLEGTDALSTLRLRGNRARDNFVSTGDGTLYRQHREESASHSLAGSGLEESEGEGWSPRRALRRQAQVQRREGREHTATGASQHAHFHDPQPGSHVEGSGPALTRFTGVRLQTHSLSPVPTPPDGSPGASAEAGGSAASSVMDGRRSAAGTSAASAASDEEGELEPPAAPLQPRISTPSAERIRRALAPAAALLEQDEAYDSESVHSDPGQSALLSHRHALISSDGRTTVMHSRVHGSDAQQSRSSSRKGGHGLRRGVSLSLGDLSDLAQVQRASQRSRPEPVAELAAEVDTEEEGGTRAAPTPFIPELHVPSPPPDDLWPRLCASKLLTEAILPLTVPAFESGFLSDDAVFSIADQHASVGDRKIVCGQWRDATHSAEGLMSAGNPLESSHSSAGGGFQLSRIVGEGATSFGGRPAPHARVLTRNIRLLMPLTGGGPLVPAQTTVEKVQRLCRYRCPGGSGGELLVIESSARSFDVPFGDSFVTEETIVVAPADAELPLIGHERSVPEDVDGARVLATGPGDAAVSPTACCRVLVFVQLNFSKATLFKGRITSETERRTAVFAQACVLQWRAHSQRVLDRESDKADAAAAAVAAAARRSPRHWGRKEDALVPPPVPPAFHSPPAQARVPSTHSPVNGSRRREGGRRRARGSTGSTGGASPVAMTSTVRPGPREPAEGALSADFTSPTISFALASHSAGLGAFPSPLQLRGVPLEDLRASYAALYVAHAELCADAWAPPERRGSYSGSAVSAFASPLTLDQPPRLQERGPKDAADTPDGRAWQLWALGSAIAALLLAILLTLLAQATAVRAAPVTPPAFGPAPTGEALRLLLTRLQRGLDERARGEE